MGQQSQEKKLVPLERGKLYGGRLRSTFSLTNLAKSKFQLNVTISFSQILTVHSLLFFRKIVEIERFAFRAASCMSVKTT